MKNLGGRSVVVGLLACAACSGGSGQQDGAVMGPVGGMAGSDLAGSGGAAGLAGPVAAGSERGDVLRQWRGHAGEVRRRGIHSGLIAYSLQKPSLERIGEANGCMPGTHAAVTPASSGDTVCVSLDGCPSGVDVTGCTVTGGGHVWFGDANCGTGAPCGCAFVGANSSTLVNTDAAWDFFAAHAR
jgi:poly(3-hydroxybutyrate) depolymerase